MDNPTSKTTNIDSLTMAAGNVTTETLLRATASWNGVPYQPYPTGAPEISVLKITIPAKCVLRWHEHPMPTAAYVLSGEIKVEEPDGKTQHFAAGQVIPEPVNTVHRGTVGETDAVFIVFYAGVKEMPLAKKH
jgi:quercetin dioxygenase-like cupin family protein